MPFAYPKATKYDRVIPKSKIYQHSMPSAKLKAMFVKQVDQIRWRHKLSANTLNISAEGSIAEIQVVRINLKPQFSRQLQDDQSIAVEILRCIDKAIPHPIIFEISRDVENKGLEQKQPSAEHKPKQSYIQTVAAYKRPSDADKNRWVTSEYFASDWQNNNNARPRLPVALELTILYEQVLAALLPYKALAGESIQQRIERCESIKKTQKDLIKHQVKLLNEKQFNRKVAINADVRRLQRTLAELMNNDLPHAQHETR